MIIGRISFLLLVATLVEDVHPKQQELSHMISTSLEKMAGVAGAATDQTLWTPEIAVHMLSLLETIHTKLAAWDVRLSQVETQVSSSQKDLEQRIEKVQDQVTSKLSDVESMVAAVEQRQENTMTAVEQRLVNHVTVAESAIHEKLTAVEEKLDLKISHLKEILKDSMKETFTTHSDISSTGLTLELSQSGKSVIDGVVKKLEKVADKLDERKERHLEHLRNTTFDLQTGLDLAVDSLLTTSRELSTSITTVKEELLDNSRNMSETLEQMVTHATEYIAQTRSVIVQHVTDSLDTTREFVLSTRNETFQQFELTSDLVRDVRGLSTPLDLVKEELTSAVERLEMLLNISSEGNNGTLSHTCAIHSQSLHAKLEKLDSNLRTRFESQFESCNATRSTSDEFYIVSKEQTLESCKKGMLERPAMYGLPYSLVYSGHKIFLCDTVTESGGWILIQHRSKGNINFLRKWEDYKNGFGSVNTDFWVGLDTIHKLTNSGTYELRIDLKYGGTSRFAHYATFSVGSESDNYALSVGPYDGTAGDSLSYHDGMEFTTIDRDNDENGKSCAESYAGAWWYKSCHTSNLNGKWGENDANGLTWEIITGYRHSVTFSEMKIRRII